MLANLKKRRIRRFRRGIMKVKIEIFNNLDRKRTVALMVFFC
jgi:hypothetical protein